MKNHLYLNVSKNQQKKIHNSPKRKYLEWAERFLIAWNGDEIFAVGLLVYQRLKSPALKLITEPVF